MILEDENIELFVPPLDGNTVSTDNTLKDEKKTRKHGLLNWLKLKVCRIWLQEIYGPFLRFIIRSLHHVAYQITTRTAYMEFGLAFLSISRVNN